MKRFLITCFLMGITLISIAHGSVYRTLGEIKNAENVYIEFSHYENKEQFYKRVVITDEKNKEYLKNLFGRAREYGELPCKCPTDNISVIFDTSNGKHTFSFGVSGDHLNYFDTMGKYVHFSDGEYCELLRFFLTFDEIGFYKRDILEFFKWR